MSCPYSDEELDYWDGVCNPMGDACYECGEWHRETCCEGYLICTHPLSTHRNFPGSDDCLSPSEYCWGFRPSVPVESLADLVGCVISSPDEYQGWSRDGDKLKVYFKSRRILEIHMRGIRK